MCSEIIQRLQRKKSLALLYGKLSTSSPSDRVRRAGEAQLSTAGSGQAAGQQSTQAPRLASELQENGNKGIFKGKNAIKN